MSVGVCRFYCVIALSMVVFLFVFFFSSRRRHTRYIGDWSSDVCSSDLLTATGASGHAMLQRAEPGPDSTLKRAPDEVKLSFTERLEPAYSSVRILDRSEERRVGKECRSRGSRDAEKKKMRTAKHAEE